VVLCFSCLALGFGFVPPSSRDATHLAVYRQALVICWVAFLCDSAWEPKLVRAVYQGQFGLEAVAEVSGRLAEAMTLWMLVCLPQVRIVESL
jgi:hypothetical protein